MSLAFTLVCKPVLSLDKSCSIVNDAIITFSAGIPVPFNGWLIAGGAVEQFLCQAGYQPGRMPAGLF